MVLVEVFTVQGNCDLYFFSIYASRVIFNSWRSALDDFFIDENGFRGSKPAKLAHEWVLIIASIIDQYWVEEVTSNFIRIDQHISDCPNLNFSRITCHQVREVVETELVGCLRPR